MDDNNNFDDYADDQWSADDPEEEFEENLQQLPPEEAGELSALANTTDDVTEAEEQVLPEELQVTNPYELIPIAIASNRHLQITYTNRKMEMKIYTIEPYEIGGNKSHPAGYLWGWDIAADTIKSFLLSNISDIQLLNTTFIPRF